MCWPIFCSASLKSSIDRFSAFWSDPLAALFSASSFVFTSVLTSSGILSALSLMTFSAWWIMWSAWLRSSTSSRLARSSPACASASLTMRSTSTLPRVEDAVIVTDCSRPVPLSCALTLRMPLASRSYVTSICGMPRGAGAMPSRWKRPSVRLSRAISRSPCRTWTSTDVWLSAAVENTRLDRSADGHDLVGVDALVRLLAPGQVLDQLLGDRHARGATDQHDLVDLLRRQVGVLQRGQEWSAAPLCQVGRQRLELGAGERHLEVLRTGLVRGDERQVHASLEPARELDLGALRGLGEPLQRLAVGLQVDAVGLLELFGEPVHDPAVVVVAAEVRVARDGLDLEYAVAHVEHRHVIRATTQVEDQDGLVGLLVEAVRE